MGIGLLTRLGFAEDAADPAFMAARAQAEEAAARARVLATAPEGIPPQGALALLRADPLTWGPRLFEANCSTCHRVNGHDGLGVVPDEAPAASDLAGYGSRTWLTGLLDPERIATAAYFGATQHETGRMARFVQRGVAAFDEAEREQLRKVIVAVSAEAGLPAQAVADAAERGLIEEGRALFGDQGVDCARCHTLGAMTEGDVGPVLTGWASREWMLGMLRDPGHESYYGDRNDRMPAFGAEEILSEVEMGLIVDWLRGDWYEPD
jgi:ubiquinol-cytochrome c reductase cytochrome b subunit